ncbi:nucleotidyltransferase domain-containing protein [Anaerobranca gottschalkii]|uniref:Nucleotidyltransferase domain-containing protein n=1 Tax=Anaerobranca gottschalkii DSM 13577 TaxID=1120990 RepID=A0A1I0A4R4_9FIRM|nr:nucleotidyltransferase domain-containing protein [Anaerobranca gottschalkii]SES89102.1 Nucleotidyltransferase domain-containing protein [Anaerobranca gottschalkii DSM 13577]
MLKKINFQNRKIDLLLMDLEKRLKNIYGEKLKKILLYGSYARGDNDEESDLDIMLLLDMDEEEIKRKQGRLLDVVVDLTTQYGIVLSIIENNYDHFYEWAEVLPFFANIKREGIDIYG